MTLTIRGKGDKTRTIPLSSRAWLEIAPAFADAIVDRGRASPVVNYQDRFARQIITNLGKKVALRRTISSHDLRATFATAVYDKTKDIRATQELLGHSSSTTTELYTGIDMDTMRGAADVA